MDGRGAPKPRARYGTKVACTRRLTKAWRILSRSRSGLRITLTTVCMSGDRAFVIVVAGEGAATPLLASKVGAPSVAALVKRRPVANSAMVGVRRLKTAGCGAGRGTSWVHGPGGEVDVEHRRHLSPLLVSSFSSFLSSSLLLLTANSVESQVLITC
ncbi:hypothetical protein BS78_09G076600 [Paspalum vaginatum]|nr:hypothetical protein BS78_09G076600 [Paspalum vaginatum]